VLLAACTSGEVAPPLASDAGGDALTICALSTCAIGDICVQPVPSMADASLPAPSCRTPPAQCAGNVTCSCINMYDAAHTICPSGNCDDTMGSIRCLLP
jgi:hypothetical protein